MFYSLILLNHSVWFSLFKNHSGLFQFGSVINYKGKVLKFLSIWFEFRKSQKIILSFDRLANSSRIASSIQYSPSLTLLFTFLSFFSSKIPPKTHLQLLKVLLKSSQLQILLQFGQMLIPKLVKFSFCFFKLHQKSTSVTAIIKMMYI